MPVYYIKLAPNLTANLFKRNDDLHLSIEPGANWTHAFNYVELA